MLMENHFICWPRGSGRGPEQRRPRKTLHVAVLNLRHGRSGTPWEGRFRANLWRQRLVLAPPALSNSIRCASGTRTKQGVGVIQRSAPSAPTTLDRPNTQRFGAGQHLRCWEHVYRTCWNRACVCVDDASRITQCVLRIGHCWTKGNGLGWRQPWCGHARPRGGTQINSASGIGRDESFDPTIFRSIVAFFKIT